MTPENKRAALQFKQIPAQEWELPEKYEAARPAPMLRGADWARESEHAPTRHVWPTADWHVQCQIIGLETLSHLVEINPRIRSGIPVLKGTRITIAQLYAELSQTDGPAAVARRCRIDVDLVKEFLDGMSLIVNKPMK